MRLALWPCAGTTCSQQVFSAAAHLAEGRQWHSLQGQVPRHVAEQDLVIAAILQYEHSALLFRMIIISNANELHHFFLNSWDFIAPYAY